MGQIIEFNNSLNSTNYKIKEIFKETLDDIKKIREEDMKSEIGNNDLDFLNRYIESLSVKAENGNWKTSAAEEKFIDCYNSFKQKNMDKVSKVFLESELIYVSDIDSSILNEDDNYVYSVVSAIDTNSESFGLNNKVMIDKIIKTVKNSTIKKIFADEKNIKRKMENIIEAIVEGEDILTIYSWYNSDNSDELTLDNGILTLNKVYDYYMNQAQGVHEMKTYSYQKTNENAYYEDAEYDRNISSISKILLLKHYPEKYKELYLRIVKSIKENRNLIDQINEVVKLTDFYIENGENIVNFSENDIMLYMINGPEEKSDKVENRRF